MIDITTEHARDVLSEEKLRTEPIRIADETMRLCASCAVVAGQSRGTEPIDQRHFAITISRYVLAGLISELRLGLSVEPHHTGKIENSAGAPQPDLTQCMHSTLILKTRFKRGAIRLSSYQLGVPPLGGHIVTRTLTVSLLRKLSETPIKISHGLVAIIHVVRFLLKLSYR